MNALSFVVDNLPLHYHQAKLLLLSLEYNSEYSKKDIVVHCLNRVDKEFLNYLRENEYTYHMIEPYLDGKYCNKLQQLRYFEDKDIDGVILMDADMFVMDKLSDIKGESILAKRVDAPNPLLSTLQNIYKKASLREPAIGKSDWSMPNNETFENNFNGGFYYIPKKQITLLNREWRKWAEWLYAQPELFDVPSQFIHVDQISFSLALHANSLEYKQLCANYNFPIHSDAPLESFDTTKEPMILHYHREVDKDGLLSYAKIKEPKIIESIKRANLLILEKI